MRQFKKIFKQDEGSTIVFVGLMMIAILSILGLIIDGGTLYLKRVELQKVADAAVLSGAQELTNTQDAVTHVVDTVLTDHGESNSLSSLNITMNKEVSIDLTKNVPMAFSKLFGNQSVPVHVHAAAALKVMGRAKGVAPLGIDDSINLDYYTTYKLKVDQTQVSSGNFGILALGGTGAETYYDNLINGYQHEIKVGDILDTQTGNVAGKTRTAVQSKLNQCPYTPGAYKDRDCKAVILIPVYQPYTSSTNQLKSVKITGFAYFWITSPMDSKDTSITGMFIKRAGTGFNESGSLDRGAYSIRLVE